MRLADSSQKNIKPKQGWLEIFLMTFIPLILSTVSELAKSDLFNRLFWQLNNSQLCNSTFSAIKTREIFFLCSLRIVYWQLCFLWVCSYSFSLPISLASSQRPQGTWTGSTALWVSWRAMLQRWSEKRHRRSVTLALQRLSSTFRPRGLREFKCMCQLESSNWMQEGFCWSWDRLSISRW